jgi:hypothetical protein
MPEPSSLSERASACLGDPHTRSLASVAGRHDALRRSVASPAPDQLDKLVRP